MSSTGPPSPTRPAGTLSGDRAHQATLRASNLALVLRTVLAAPSPPSRADVAAATSMTRSTVSRLVDDLLAGGFLVEADRAEVTRPGRPATPLAAAPRRHVALGLQVNASFLAVRLIDLTGAVLGQRLVADDLIGSDPALTLTRLADLARDVLSEAPDDVVVAGAGLALPGIVSTHSGTLLRAPNLRWSDVDAAALLPAEGLSGAAVHIGNEADLAALTVAMAAPGRPGPLEDFLYLSGEIGIGGAAVVDGVVMTGRHGWAGEVGHVCVDPSGPPCPCGSTGCLERYAGKLAMLSAAGLAADASAADLSAAVAAGDADARGSVDTAAWALGVALAGVVNVLDIPTIVLGGHLSQVADLLRPRLEDVLRTRVLSARWVAPVVQTANGDPAPGATGAALRELTALVHDPATRLP